MSFEIKDEKYNPITAPLGYRNLKSSTSVYTTLGIGSYKNDGDIKVNTDISDVLKPNIFTINIKATKPTD